MDLRVFIVVTARDIDEALGDAQRSRGLVVGNNATIHQQIDALDADLTGDRSLFDDKYVDIFYVPQRMRLILRKLRSLQTPSPVKELFVVDATVAGLFAYATVAGLFAYATSQSFAPTPACDELCVSAIQLRSVARAFRIVQSAFSTLTTLSATCRENRREVDDVMSGSRFVALTGFVLAHRKSSILQELSPGDVELLLLFIFVSDLNADRKVVVLDAVSDACALPRETTTDARATTADALACLVECFRQSSGVTPYGDVRLHPEYKLSDVSPLFAELRMRSNAFFFATSAKIL